jgi:hypothetical protein
VYGSLRKHAQREEAMEKKVKDPQEIIPVLEEAW